jgi:hypothetical protein
MDLDGQDIHAFAQEPPVDGRPLQRAVAQLELLHFLQLCLPSSCPPRASRGRGP